MNSFPANDSSNTTDEAIQTAIESYSLACQVACRAVDNLGETTSLSTPDDDQVEVCSFAGSVLPGGRSAGDHVVSSICSNAHLYGGYQSERFSGEYVFFCPLGLTHWASPVIRENATVCYLLAGPVQMVEPDDFMIEELLARNGIHKDYLPGLRDRINKVPVIDTKRVQALSKMLGRVAASLSDETFDLLSHKTSSGDLQSEIWEQINFMKSYAMKDESDLIYPIDKERMLLDKIEQGDKQSSQRILNEILGFIFFSSGGSIEVIRARVIELVVLLSRAAIRGGADTEQIFGLNFTYLGKIQQFKNIDEIAYWLSGIMTRFTDQVFNLTNVKHADVIYRATDYIRKNYMNRVTMEEAAAMVFLSPAYFSRIFKEETGSNFNSYVNKIRIDAAKKMLLNDNLSLSDISTLVGFDGQSYFSKVFKRVTGVTPGRYREAKGRIGLL